MVCYGIIMVWYGVMMMWYDITEDLNKYDVIGLEWLCNKPNRVIKSQRNVDDMWLTSDWVLWLTLWLTHEKWTKSIMKYENFNRVMQEHHYVITGFVFLIDGAQFCGDQRSRSWLPSPQLNWSMLPAYMQWRGPSGFDGSSVRCSAHFATWQSSTAIINPPLCSPRMFPCLNQAYWHSVSFYSFLSRKWTCSFPLLPK